MIGAPVIISAFEKQTIIEELRFLNLIRLRAHDVVDALAYENNDDSPWVVFEAIEALNAALTGKGMQ